MAEMNDTKATNSTDAEVNYKEDLFCWTIEGVGILIIGLIGVFGNSCSMVLFSRQKVHRIFHHLLLLLSVFDLVSTRVGHFIVLSSQTDIFVCWTNFLIT